MLLWHVLIHVLRIRHVLGRRCVGRYVLGLRYAIRRSVKRATGVYGRICIYAIFLRNEFYIKFAGLNCFNPNVPNAYIVFTWL